LGTFGLVWQYLPKFIRIDIKKTAISLLSGRIAVSFMHTIWVEATDTRKNGLSSFTGGLPFLQVC